MEYTKVSVNSTNYKDKIGLFQNITHFKNIFKILEEFLADGKSFFNLISVNKTFRNLTHINFDKMIKVIEFIKGHPNKYLLFSPYSWLRNTDFFEFNKNKFLLTMKDQNFSINETEFTFLFNLSKRFFDRLDFENYGMDLIAANILFKYLKNFMNVKILILSHCKIDIISYEEVISKIIKKCFNLEVLRLEHNNLKVDSVMILNDSLFNLKRLKDLNLQGNSFSKVINNFTFLKDCKNLKCLNLSNCKLTEEDLIYFSDILNPNLNSCQLESLDLSFNFFSSSFKIFFESIKNNSFLENLFLTKTNIDDNVCLLIKEYLKVNKNLRRLFISKNQISPTGWANIIDGLKKNKNLEILSMISENKIGKEEEILKIYFSELKYLNLDCLNLNNNQKLNSISETKLIEKISKSNLKWKINLEDFELNNENFLEWTKLE